MLRAMASTSGFGAFRQGFDNKKGLGFLTLRISVASVMNFLCFRTAF
jgi:hypothetical protein